MANEKMSSLEGTVVLSDELLSDNGIEISGFNEIEDLKIKFETLQQVCDLLSDLINNFNWSVIEKNQLVYIWQQVIRVYWHLCEQFHIDPLPKK